MEASNLLLAILIVLVTVAHFPVNARLPYPLTLPGVFILGDSTADVGTNNFLPNSQFKANFPFNGIDFANSTPTGRFSNGLNSADFLAIMMGLDGGSPPPYLAFGNRTQDRRRQALVGFNFASAGSGILDLTGNGPFLNGSGNVNVVALRKQVIQFSSVKRSLIGSKGKNNTKKFLSKSLIFISTGSNDILGYYYSNSTIPKQQFLFGLGAAYKKYIKNLINLGARKFGIIGIPPVGCCPSQRAHNTTGGCLEGLNELAVSFNLVLKNVIAKLSSECPDIVYSLGNAFEMTINIIRNPGPFGFDEVESGCCGAGKFNGQSICSPTASLCPNRTNYLFWDKFHPTEAASKLAAFTLYNGGPQFVSPINFKQLVMA